MCANNNDFREDKKIKRLQFITLAFTAVNRETRTLLQGLLLILSFVFQKCEAEEAETCVMIGRQLYSVVALLMAFCLTCQLS